MANAAAEGEVSQEKRRPLGAKGWAAAGILAMTLGGGGFYATYAGLPGGWTDRAPMDQGAASTFTPTFLELDPLMITVGGEGSIRQLRFRAFLQLAPGGNDSIAGLQPRILDIFATYLRALDLATLENPAALLRIRAQLLRRLQLLAGPGAVSDLLIIDFVIT